MTAFWKSLTRSIRRQANNPRRPSRWRHTLDRLEAREVPANFTPGNLVIYRVGDGVANLANTGNSVFIDEYTPAGTLVQSIAMPDSGAGTKLVASGTSSSEGFLTLSPDGKYLTMTGYNVTPPHSGSLTTSTATTVNRTVAVMDATGSSSLTLFSDFSSGGSPRSAVTTDGSKLWMVGGQGGVRFGTVNTSVVQTSTQLSTTLTNMRVVQIFDGQLYVSDQSGSTIRLGTVGSGIPETNGQTINSLSGFQTSGSPYGYFFADLDGSPGLDTLYVSDDGANAGAGPGFQKWSLVAGTWTLNNVISIGSNALRGLTGHVRGNCVQLFATSDSGSASKLWTLTDTSDFNQNNNGVPTDLLTAGTKTAFRGVMFTPTSTTPAESTSISTGTTTTSTGPVNYTVAFNQAVSGLTASNFTLNTTGDANGTIGTPSTSDGGLTWTVSVTGITGNGTLRLDLVNGTGVSPTLYFLPFDCGTTVTVTNGTPNATLDVVAGKAIYTAGLGKSNNTTLSLTGLNYTINDPSESITLTANAIAAGWTGNGTSTVSDTNGGTTALSFSLIDGTDSFTISGLADPLTVLGGGQAGDAAHFNAAFTVTGAVSVTGFETIDTTGGTLAVTDLSLGASTIGSSFQPIVTQASTVVANGGDGGVFVNEADGANFTFTASGTGSVTLNNAAGTLTIAGDSKWGSGDVTLNSDDGVVVNAALGDGLTTGNLAINVNTDGAGVEGYNQSTTGNITTTAGNVTITVNAFGGNGDAVLGTGTAKSYLVNVGPGSILWNAGFVIPGLDGSNANTLGGASVSLNTSGTTSAIGTAASPIQTAASTSVQVVAGSGGAYVTDWAAQDTNLTASATGAGNLQLWAGNSTNNGWLVASATAETGNISIKADDFLTVNGVIGGPTFTGTILLEADRDGQNTQTFRQNLGGDIVTSNTSPNAVVINVYATGSANTNLRNITTGPGGGVTVNAAALLGNPTDTTRNGQISQVTGTTIDVGATGTVTFIAKDNPIGSTFSSNGPMNVIAGKVSASTTSALPFGGDIFVNSVGSFTFDGSSTGDGQINVNSGDKLTLGGNISTGTASISLTAVNGITQTSGTVITDGTLTVNPGAGQLALFTTSGNKAGTLVIPSGTTTRVDGTFDPSGAVQVDGALQGSGSVGAVTVLGSATLDPGASPGKLTTGNLVLNLTSTYKVELNGPAAGTGYDQVKVNGTVDLNDATLSGSLGFVPGPGAKFVIIDNDGSDSISTTFSGLAEGANVLIGATNFKISYVGGDGNDVVLTAPGVAPSSPTATVTFDNGTGQRSMIRSLTVNFSEPVNLGANPFTVTRLGTSTIPTPAGNVILSVNPAGPASAFTITFNDPTFAPTVGSAKSLIDGLYSVTLNAGDITSVGSGQPLDGDGNGTGGDSQSTNFHRLFGDINGDGFTDNVDLVAFRLANGSTGPAPPYDAGFDVNGDNFIDNNDLLAFRDRIGDTP